MQPRDAGSGSGATVTREDKVKQILDEIIEKLPEEFSMTEIMNKVEERTPYVIVAFQECERMNYLTGEMKRSLKELDLGLKVTGMCSVSKNFNFFLLICDFYPG